VCENRLLFVWVDPHVSSCRQQHPECERAIRLAYPNLYCKLPSSSNSTNNKFNKQIQSRSPISIRHIFTWIFFTQCPILPQPKTLTFSPDIHRSVHRRLLSRNTNNVQLCNWIYYSKVYWRLHMFRAAHRSSSGALNCICSLWFICCNKVKEFLYIIHSPYYNITIVFLIKLACWYFYWVIYDARIHKYQIYGLRILCTKLVLFTRADIN
jgi:hypothetical protein